ncbi:hypothetical protein JOE61_000356 [Nocardioides salarius]|uniref:Transposase n=1 Tax=Nocardioides salarius TaxID=374513 RepID=A0ABS2M5S3_9ACTN|nr:hypothetical protein [Nocardioides salarius]MBM7506542.1 hypothetical protein [Nocardioides salarius]
MIDLPNLQTIPRSTRTCPDCEATPAGCRGVRALRGTYCCARCDHRGGNHDHEETR